MDCTQNHNKISEKKNSLIKVPHCDKCMFVEYVSDVSGRKKRRLCTFSNQLIAGEVATSPRWCKLRKEAADGESTDSPEINTHNR